MQTIVNITKYCVSYDQQELRDTFNVKDVSPSLVILEKPMKMKKNFFLHKKINIEALLNFITFYSSVKKQVIKI